ncbi:MAG TPA: NAD(P)/FAD-dependent oxidoreductase [Euzebyales bacterium]|nr:NAD(P)/FAD-dependent oxidoreductase [Euzebyales bacterium]
MSSHDVVIVGARPAGAATALLLARAGHDVLVVDRARYGSDTLSTHALMRGGVLQLERWGLLDRIIAEGTPPVHRVTFDYGGAPVIVDLDRPLYAPRRTVLDRVLVDAAREAGAEVRFGVNVTGVRTDEDGRAVGITARDADGAATELDARLTVGADGARSLVARSVGAAVTMAARHAAAVIYGHFHGVPVTGYEWSYGPRSASGVVPTNDGLVCVFVIATPSRYLHDLRPDPEAAVDLILRELSPQLADRIAGAHRHGPLRGFPGFPGWLRRPFGPGWALVGDAGYFKDPFTAHGISDALRDAELLVHAVDEGLTGAMPMSAALAGYERVRDDLSRPLLDATDAIASFDWRLPDLQELHSQLSAAMQEETRFLRALRTPPVRTTLALGA